MHHVRSGTAVFTTGPEGRILTWNAEAERLTGIDSAEAVGRPCWELIAGRDPDGALVCHSGCSVARLAREGWPVRCFEIDLRTPNGEKRVSLTTIVLQGDDGVATTILHPVQEVPEAPAAAADDARADALTPRQREILVLLAQGVRAKQIATKLMLSETTVRNHIQAILLVLGVHSQLEAVARAHTLALAPDRSAA